MGQSALVRVPESTVKYLAQLIDGRHGIGLERSDTPAPAAQSISPPLLYGELELPEEQALELRRFFQRYRGAAVEKPADEVRGRMLVTPRRCEKLHTGRFYLEFEALALL